MGYINATLDPYDTALPKFDCIESDLSRYAHLKPPVLPSQVQCFFGLKLHENIPTLSQLLGSVAEATRFLEPEYCDLSIVKGDSPDATAKVLAALQQRLDK